MLRHLALAPAPRWLDTCAGGGYLPLRASAAAPAPRAGPRTRVRKHPPGFTRRAHQADAAARDRLPGCLPNVARFLRRARPAPDRRDPRRRGPLRSVALAGPLGVGLDVFTLAA